MFDELRPVADCSLPELWIGQHLPGKVRRRQVTVHIRRIHLLHKRPLLVLLAQLDVLRYLVDIQVNFKLAAFLLLFCCLQKSFEILSFLLAYAF